MHAEVVLHRPCVGARLVDPHQPLAPAPPAAPSAPEAREAPAAADERARDALMASLREVECLLRSHQERQWQLVDQLQEASVEIAMAVVGRLWRDHLAELPVRPMVESLMAAVRPQAPALLRIDPQQWAAWQQIPASTLPPDMASLSIVADPNLPPGTCRLEGEEWTIESSVLSLLAELRQQLLEELADAQLGLQPAQNMHRSLPGSADGRTPA